MKRVALAAALVAAAAFTVEAQQVKLENQIKYRKAAYQLMNFNFGNLAAMAEDKKPFNKEEATRNAETKATQSSSASRVPSCSFSTACRKRSRKSSVSGPKHF